MESKRGLLGTKRVILWRQPKNPVGTLFSKSIQLEPCWSLLCNPARWLSWLERGASTPRLWVQFQPDPNVLTVTVESICYTVSCIVIQIHIALLLVYNTSVYVTIDNVPLCNRQLPQVTVDNVQYDLSGLWPCE